MAASERGRGRLRPLARLWAVPDVLWLCVLGAASCGGARAGAEQSNAPGPGRVITADRIAASGAKTAWDALRRTVPTVQLRESGGRPARILRRGRGSIVLDDQVRVMLDNTRLYDLTLLDQIPAADILSIEVLSGLDATTEAGGNSTSGLIIIRTKSGSD
jgi:outer membrane receptor protein involved in Fe transport